MTISSMTGFASLAGQGAGFDWQWELRSVNARGLDLRMRLPEGVEALEPKLREAAQKLFRRGALQVSLRLRRGEEAGAPRINAEAVKQLLAAARTVGEAADEAGMAINPLGIGDLLALRGVLDGGRDADALGPVIEAVAAQIPEILTALAEQRRREGAALAAVLEGQLDRIEDLTSQAAATAESRAAKIGETLRARVAALIEAQDRVEEGRLAQELALIAVKADVTEEIDRLHTHVGAARGLLGETGPVGRKLDFLMQEFNREANTLCSKSQDSALTAIGLELKVVIDQMREQCQNVE